MKKVVCIGGGTGLSVLLRGLKKYKNLDIISIVTVMDDGGSSGRLKTEFGVLPPGDVRNCLLALSDREDIMTKIFSYRFPITKKNPEVGGHSLGNLLMVALTDIYKGFDKAIQKASEILNIRGRVLPITLQPTSLAAVLEDGTIEFGESNISRAKKPIKKMFLNPSGIKHNPLVLREIRTAGMIIVGPGSLFTSILPNLIIQDVVKEISLNKKAFKVYVCNVMTQPGETDNYTAEMHVKKIYEHCKNNFLFDYMIVNSTKLPRRILDRYKKVGSYPVKVESIKKLKKLVKKDVIVDDFLDASSNAKFAWHDYHKLAKVMAKILDKNH